MKTAAGLMLAGALTILVGAAALATREAPRAAQSAAPPPTPVDRSDRRREDLPPVDVEPAPYRSPEDAEVREVDGASQGAIVPPGGVSNADGRVIEVRTVNSTTGAVMRGVVSRLVDRTGHWTAQAERLHSDFSDDTPSIRVDVDPPEGFGALRPYAWSGPAAASATGFLLDLPLFPARSIRLRVVDTSGRPVAGVRCLRATFDGGVDWFGRMSSIGISLRGSASRTDGTLVLSGAPRIAFGRVTLEAGVQQTTSRDSWLVGTLGGIDLDEPEPGEVRTLVVSPGQRRLGRGVCCSGGAACGSSRDVGPIARLMVRVVRGDGKPAAYVRVSAPHALGETDVDECVLLDRIPVGRCDVLARAHGYLPTVVSAEAGTDTEVLIRESAPRRVRVTVVDARGRPLAAARLRTYAEDVPGPAGNPVSVYESVAQMSNGTEMLDPLTGPDGCVDLIASAGNVSYHVALGRATATVKSSADAVRIVLTAPEK